MWCFFDEGFVSVVAARQDGGKSHKVDPNTLNVRARERTHLEALVRRFPDLLAGVSIVESRGTDYRFRMFVQKPAFAEMMKRLVLELEYPNYKNRVRQKIGSGKFEGALHEVWGVMRALQDD